MKNEKWIDVIGGIDPNLVENAEKASANDVVSSSKTRRFTGFKRIAVIAAAVILTVGGLLMLNANVRAAVLGVFVRNTDDGRTVVKFADPDSEDETGEHKTVYDVTVGYVPDGFIVNDIDCSLWPAPMEESRIVDLLDGPAEDPYNNPSRQVRIDICSSRRYEQTTKDDFEGRYSHTTIRGLDAFISNMYDEDEELKKLYEQMGIEPNDISRRVLIFGDSDIMVSIFCSGLSTDELIKIAENVVW